jgi:hypothetical protein
MGRLGSERWVGFLVGWRGRPHDTRDKVFDSIRDACRPGGWKGFESCALRDENRNSDKQPAFK